MPKKETLLPKKVSLNYTEHAYHDAVNRLKSMLADTYNAVKHNSRRAGFDYDDTDNISVIVFLAFPIACFSFFHSIFLTFK